jgi:hypothetical protein
MPSQKKLFVGDFYDNDYWRDLSDIVWAQTLHATRERAINKLEDRYEFWETFLDGYAGPKIDPTIFDLLWPLAEQAHRLITLHWSSIKRLAADLLKTRSLTRKEIEVRLPWAIGSNSSATSFSA